MTKRTRQYIGLLTAVAVYYLIHEGAHFLYALSHGVFKKINFMGLGIQIDIFADRLTPLQLAVFCLVGVLATQISAYVMTALSKRICRAPSKLLRACCYYSTIILLLLDPLYLSILCGFFGGGDMNGIMLLVHESTARMAFGLLLMLNGLIFWKLILPQYSISFAE
ncbi:MAG: hypothetical protein IJD81_08890 [Oscillospiraceae bacterium]|nr:hypothetical protein [Oscillospiraceae bacterium]